MSAAASTFEKIGAGSASGRAASAGQARLRRGEQPTLEAAPRMHAARTTSDPRRMHPSETTGTASVQSAAMALATPAPSSGSRAVQLSLWRCTTVSGGTADRSRGVLEEHHD